MKTTGHDIHFLSRLNERTDDATTERALRLYRDPELVRVILSIAPEAPPDSETPFKAAVSLGERLRLAGIAKAPDPEERIAIALSEGEHPPTVIVARNGHFITCLAAGMRTKSTPMVPWEHAEPHLLLDDASDAYVAMDRDSKVEALMKTISLGGFRMPREDFFALRSIAPLVWNIWVQQMGTCFTEFLDLVIRGGQLPRLHDDNPISIDIWRHYHRLAHFLVLSALGGDSNLEDWFITADGDAPYFRLYLQRIISVGGFPLASRALWHVGQRALVPGAAKPFFTRVKAQLVKAPDWLSWKGAALSLLMIGAQCRKLAPEVRRCLQEHPAPQESEDAYERENAAVIRDMAHLAMRREEELPEAELVALRTWAGGWCRKFRMASAKQFIDPEGLSSLEFARRLHMNITEEIILRTQLVSLVMVIPYLASMRAEDFFHPASEATILERGYDHDLVTRVCKPFRPEHVPTRAEQKPGRNDPCLCQSGKKYKKCCGG